MLDVASDSKIYLCTGCTDMRKGINGLSILAQSILSDASFIRVSYLSLGVNKLTG